MTEKQYKESSPLPVWILQQFTTPPLPEKQTTIHRHTSIFAQDVQHRLSCFGTARPLHGKHSRARIDHASRQSRLLNHMPCSIGKRQGSTITCPAQNGTIAVSNGTAFLVECAKAISDTTNTTAQKVLTSAGIDYSGGDLPNQPIYPGGIAQCIVACAKEPLCVDFTFTGSACYLKGSVGANVYYDGAAGAKLIGVVSCLS